MVGGAKFVCTMPYLSWAEGSDAANMKRCMETRSQLVIHLASDQYEFKILKLMHSYVNNKENLPDVFQNLFRTRSSFHSYRTRSEDLFEVPKTRNRFGNCAISVKGAKIWNSQPAELRIIAGKKKYLNHLKQFKLGSYE